MKIEENLHSRIFLRTTMFALTVICPFSPTSAFKESNFATNNTVETEWVSGESIFQATILIDTKSVLKVIALH